MKRHKILTQENEAKHKTPGPIVPYVRHKPVPLLKRLKPKDCASIILKNMKSLFIK